jgi:hypothetical protein
MRCFAPGPNRVLALAGRFLYGRAQFAFRLPQDVLAQLVAVVALALLRLLAKPVVQLCKNLRAARVLRVLSPYEFFGSPIAACARAGALCPPVSEVFIAAARVSVFPRRSRKPRALLAVDEPQSSLAQLAGHLHARPSRRATLGPSPCPPPRGAPPAPRRWGRPAATCRARRTRRHGRHDSRRQSGRCRPRRRCAG